MLKKPIDHKQIAYLWNFFRNNPAKYKSTKDLFEYVSSIIFLPAETVSDIFDELVKTKNLWVVERGNKISIQTAEVFIENIVEEVKEEISELFESEHIEEEKPKAKRSRKKTEE